MPSPFIDNYSGGALDDQVDAQTELGNDDIAAGMQQFENELATEQQDIRNRVTPSDDPAKPADATVIGTLDPKLQGKALVRYTVLYFIPVISSQIAFALWADRSHKCSLEFDLAANDVYGKRITGLSQTFTSPPFATEQVQ